jgi:cobalamin biosynthesis protein CobW
VQAGPVADGDRFHDRLAAVIRAHDVLRVKGFVDVPGRDRRQIVQAVGDRVQHYFDRKWEPGEMRATRLVVIGKKGLDRAAISAALGALGG